jgi:hypothetical protein
VAPFQDGPPSWSRKDAGAVAIMPSVVVDVAVSTVVVEPIVVVMVPGTVVVTDDTTVTVEVTVEMGTLSVVVFFVTATFVFVEDTTMVDVAFTVLVLPTKIVGMGAVTVVVIVVAATPLQRQALL